MNVSGIYSPGNQGGRGQGKAIQTNVQFVKPLQSGSCYRTQTTQTAEKLMHDPVQSSASLAHDGTLASTVSGQGTHFSGAIRFGAGRNLLLLVGTNLGLQSMTATRKQPAPSLKEERQS